MPCRRLAYAKAVLVRGGYQTGVQYQKALVAIMADENSRALWNPLDTTRFSPGATPYNSFGPGGSYHVWNYARAVDGVEMTVATMQQLNMRPWSDRFHERGHSATDLCQAYAKVPWSSVGNMAPYQIVRSWRWNWIAWVRARRAVVYGNGRYPYRPNGHPIG